MASRCLALFLALALVGCGDDPTDLGTDAGGEGTDAGDVTMDAGGSGFDAGGRTTDAGDGTRDAGGTTLDAGAGDTDAGLAPIDAGLLMCTGKLGEICNDSLPCDTGETCVAFDSVGDGVCAPATVPICGGFADADCPASAPICLDYPSASGWPCATAAERDCICSKPAGRTRFPGVCVGP